MSKFKVGDKIVGNEKASGRYGITKQGWEGVVTRLHSGYYDFSAKSVKGDCEYGLHDEYFDLLVPDRKVIITHDGATTLARMFEGNKVIKSAEAKCSPHDTFDFAVGANLAYDRLMDRLAATPPIEKGPSGIDWNAFLRGEVLVECTENNRSAFIEELACKFPALFWGTGTYPLKDYEPWENNFHIIDGGLYHNNGLHGFRGSKNIKQRVTYQPAEKPQDKPAEPAPEPIKLYCVKDDPGWLTKGKIYVADEYYRFQNEVDIRGKNDATTHGKYPSWESFCMHNHDMSHCLFPLVKRPAKVGEYILPDGEDKPVKVVRKCEDGIPNCLVLEDKRHTGGLYEEMDYLVLDGYHPEPECCRCCGQPLKKESAR